MKLNEAFKKDMRLSVKYQEAIDWATKYAPKTLETYAASSRRIYRGFNSKSDTILLDSSKMRDRVSSNTENFYTLMLDNFPEWKNYPKRSRSYVCSTSLSVASRYNTPHLIIPADDVPIGVCSHSDLWDSFYRLFDAIKDIDTMEDFGAFLNTLVTYIYPTHMKLNQTSYTVLKNQLEKLTPYINEYYKFVNLSSRTTAALKICKNKFGGSLIDMLQYYMAPEKNGFTLTFAPYIHSLPSNVEVWFSGPCVAVSVNSIDTSSGDDFLKYCLEQL